MTARSLKALSAAAALVVLVACQSQTQGQGGPASSPNLPTTTPSPEHQTEATIQVQFREVVHSTLYGLPSPTLEPSDPSRLVRSWFQPDQVEEARSLRQPPTLDDLYALQMAIDSLDSCGVYFGTTGGQVYASTDAGDSWAPIVRDLPAVLSVEVQTLT